MDEFTLIPAEGGIEITVERGEPANYTPERRETMAAVMAALRGMPLPHGPFCMQLLEYPDATASGEPKAVGVGRLPAFNLRDFKARLEPTEGGIKAAIEARLSPILQTCAPAVLRCEVVFSELETRGDMVPMEIYVQQKIAASLVAGASRAVTQPR